MRLRSKLIGLALVIPVAVLGLAACEPVPDPCVAGCAPVIPTNEERNAYMVISPREIAQLATQGPAWDAVNARANATWGTPTIANQNSNVDSDVWAGALVATRTNSTVLKDKTRAALNALAANHPYDRVLAAARELPMYLQAAQLVGFATPANQASFVAFVKEAMDHTMTGHSGGTDVWETAQLSANNWGTMSRAASAAAWLYLDSVGDPSYKGSSYQGLRGELDQIQDAWLGLQSPTSMTKFDSPATPDGWQFVYNPGSGDAWHGINGAGATVNGYSISGVLPEEMRRSYLTPPATLPLQPASGLNYPWEGMDGAVLTSSLLHRRGDGVFNEANSALLRAGQWLSDPALGNLLISKNSTCDMGSTNDNGDILWTLRKYTGVSLRNRDASCVVSTTLPNVNAVGKNSAWNSWVYGNNPTGG